MKKVLLATTAAICAGGVASAEVSLSGEGKLGLKYEKDATQEWEAISSAKVKFGASFTLDANESTADGTLDNPFVVYVGSAAGQFVKIEAGTDPGAGDKKSGGLADADLNSLGLDDLSEIYYDLSTLSFGVFGNLDQFSGRFFYSSRSTTVPAGQAAVADKTAYGLEVGYSLGSTTFTAHYVKNDGVYDDDNHPPVASYGLDPTTRCIIEEHLSRPLSLRRRKATCPWRNF